MTGSTRPSRTPQALPGPDRGVRLGKFLSSLGRREEALDAAEEALAIYRALAAERPDAFRPDLAIDLPPVSWTPQVARNARFEMPPPNGRAAAAFKLARAAERKWRKLNGHALLGDVIRGVRFQDGSKVAA